MLDLGKAIKLVRSARGKSLAEVAKISGTGIPFLSLVETGERQPSLATLRRISEALELPPEVLVLIAHAGGSSLRSANEIAGGLTKALEKVATAEEELKRQLEGTERETS